LKVKHASEYNQLKNSVVTIGTFDGVHVGHQKIIQRLVKIAKQDNLQALVLTFFPHPRMVVQKDNNIKLINTIDEKANRLSCFGVDHLIIKEFTKEFSRLSALEYVRDVLVNKLHVKHLIVGYDHHFGRNRTSNIDDLREYGEFYGFKVTEISAQEINAVAVSSTKIRTALQNGDLPTANLFLGYNFCLTGKVKSGRGIGKTIGFPTANLDIQESYKLIPKKGVYVVSAIIGEELVHGIMNIGKNPTISTSTSCSVEVHFFNFHQDLYGLNIEVQLHMRLRDEVKFSSIALLKEQIEQDRLAAIKFIESL
jgi:riboflavin kinase/FMN adenylyltransferase